MTQKVGGIEFGVDVDASGAVTAATKITASNKDIEQSFERVEQSTKKIPQALSRLNAQYTSSSSKLREFIARQVEAGRSIDENGNVVTAYGFKAKKLTEDFERLKWTFLKTKNASDEVERAFRGITAETKEASAASSDYASKQTIALNATRGAERETTRAKKSLAGLGKNAGQAGVQLQQFFGQIQGGQSGLLALSQQGADLGIVLGRAGLGAAVGIAATALSFMIPTIRDTKTSLEKLEEIADAVGKTFETAADGSDIFSEAIQRLADRSESLARVQIAQTITDLEGKIAESANGIKEAADDIGGIKIGSGILDTITELGIQLEDVPSLFGDISGEVDKLGAGGVLAVRGVTERIDQLATQFGITREQALNLQIALDDFGSNQGAGGIAALRNQIEQLNNEVGADNKKFVKFASSLLPFFKATRTGVDRINLLRQALTDLDKTLGENSETSKETKKATEEQAQAAQKQAQSLQAQVIALESGAQAAEVYAATQRAVTDGTEEQLPSVIELINRKYELKRAQAETAQAARDEAAAMKEDEAAYREFLKAIEEGEAIKAAKQEGATNTLDAFKQGLMTEEQLRAEAYLRELEQFQEAAEILGLSKDEVRELERQKAQQHADELLSIEQKKANAEKALEEQKKRAKIQALGQTFSSLSNLMNTESRKLFEIGKAAALASSIVNAYQSITKTMTETPYPYNIPLAAAQAVAAFAQVKQIQATKFGSANTAGGQSYSGGVVANNTTQAQPEQRNVSIALTGSSFTGGDIRALIGQINEELGDGVTLSATGG